MRLLALTFILTNIFANSFCQADQIKFCERSMDTSLLTAKSDRIAEINEFTYTDSIGELRDRFYLVLQHLPLDTINQILKDAGIRYRTILDIPAESVEEVAVGSAIFLINHVQLKQVTVNAFKTQMLRYYQD